MALWWGVKEIYMKVPITSPSFNPMTWQNLLPKLWIKPFHSSACMCYWLVIQKLSGQTALEKLHHLPTVFRVLRTDTKMLIIKCYRNNNNFSSLTKLFSDFCPLHFIKWGGGSAKNAYTNLKVLVCPWVMRRGSQVNIVMTCRNLSCFSLCPGQTVHRRKLQRQHTSTCPTSLSWKEKKLHQDFGGNVETISQNHRFHGLEGSSRDHWVQTPC